MNVHPKVISSGVAGAATILIMWGLALAKIQVPPEVASAITVLISSFTGYLTPAGADQPAPPHDPAG